MTDKRTATIVISICAVILITAMFGSLFWGTPSTSTAVSNDALSLASESGGG